MFFVVTKQPYCKIMPCLIL